MLLVQPRPRASLSTGCANRILDFHCLSSDYMEGLDREHVTTAAALGSPLMGRGGMSGSQTDLYYWLECVFLPLLFTGGIGWGSEVTALLAATAPA